MLSGLDRERLSTPDWLWTRWTANMARTQHAHRPRPSTGSAARYRSEIDDAARWRSLVRQGPAADGRGRIEDLPGFADGDWWVQDAAATLPALLLGDVAGKKVIDLCAAPGGKTMQLAARGANVIAVEIDAIRAARIRENLARTKLTPRSWKAMPATLTARRRWC